MSNAEVVAQGQQVLIQNYSRYPVAMVRGSGSRLWDADGKEYIDLFAGFGAAILGHCHPELVRAATEQAGKLWHVGNQYYTEPQIEFAARLKKTAFDGAAFFCHAGMDANEAACKLARLRGKDKSPNRWKVISLNKSFHGRSLAMIAATGNPKVKVGFEPLPAGFLNIEPGDIGALERAIDSETAAVIMEPIQGEGGINLFTNEYVARVRDLCDRNGMTLIFDEVWTGCGRTGKWFAHQYFTRPDGSPILPDIMTLGKAVGGGLPVGVMFARTEVAKLLGPGTHGSTLGANPICMAVSKTIFDVIEREGLLQHANTLGEHAAARLRNEGRIRSKVQEVRGRGLMLGIELNDVPDKLVEKGMERGIVTNVTANKVIRLAPPINISRKELDAGLDRLIETIAAV
jgi:predicted acetylornithine/succinylornithine family transaminase